MAWEPISTAPMNKVILLFAVTDLDEAGTVRNWKMATGVRFSDEFEWDGRRLKDYDHQPTHWHTLPMPPNDL